MRDGSSRTDRELSYKLSNISSHRGTTQYDIEDRYELAISRAETEGLQYVGGLWYTSSAVMLANLSGTANSSEAGIILQLRSDSVCHRGPANSEAISPPRCLVIGTSVSSIGNRLTTLKEKIGSG